MWKEKKTSGTHLTCCTFETYSSQTSVCFFSGGVMLIFANNSLPSLPSFMLRNLVWWNNEEQRVKEGSPRDLRTFFIGNSKIHWDNKCFQHTYVLYLYPLISCYVHPLHLTVSPHYLPCTIFTNTFYVPIHSFASIYAQNICLLICIAMHMMKCVVQWWAHKALTSAAMWTNFHGDDEGFSYLLQCIDLVSYVLCEANVSADKFAKEGVFHSYLSFDA